MDNVKLCVYFFQLHLQSTYTGQVVLVVCVNFNEKKNKTCTNRFIALVSMAEKIKKSRVVFDRHTSDAKKQIVVIVIS